MRFLLALPVIAVVAFLVVGAVRGRVQMRSCCALPADQDSRLRVGGVDAAGAAAPVQQPVDAA